MKVIPVDQNRRTILKAIHGANASKGDSEALKLADAFAAEWRRNEELKRLETPAQTRARCLRELVKMVGRQDAAKLIRAVEKRIAERT